MRDFATERPANGMRVGVVPIRSQAVRSVVHLGAGLT